MSIKKYIPYLLLAAVAGLIFALSEYIQWYGDSYLYRFDFGTGEPIETFWEIFPSQYAHYFMMNGRVWAHVLCQGFSALWGQTAFAVCNALVYVAFILLFVKLAGSSWRHIYALLSCILMVLLITDLSYNANCQIGYVWTSTITLVFIIYYCKCRDIKRAKIWQLVLLFLLSILAGNGNEAIAIGVGASLIFDFFIIYRRLTVVQWVMLVGFGIGGLILCLSPGILDRASGDTANFVYSAYRLLITSKALSLLIMTICILKIRHCLNLKQYLVENRFLVVALLTLILFNFMIGIGETGRQLFGIELFSAILTIKALKNNAFPKWVLAILGLCLMVIYSLKVEYLHDSNEDLRVLRKEIESSSDSIIYVDFKKYSSFVKPTEVKDLQNEQIYVVCSILDDINNKGRFYQLSKNKDVSQYPIRYKVYPTAFMEILNLHDRNFASKCADGTYLVVQDRRNPATFILHRRINILGMKYPLPPYTVEFNDPYLNHDSMNVILENFKIPFIENGEIEIIRNSTES